MHKFKIGDKVKVVDEKAMVAHCIDCDAIKEGTVKAVYEDGCVKLQEDHNGWLYPETCLDYARKFNPKPGDTIVCNNGLKFTACKAEDYRYFDYYPECKIATEVQEPGHNHMCWHNFDGIAEHGFGYNIKEILPAPVSPPEPVPIPKTYTVREVLDAYFEYSGYGGGAPSDMAVDGTQKILARYADPDYTTYLELKKRFEN